MKTVDLIQGSPEWHAHRRAHWNASDAPAMMGASPYKTRAQLLRELATGIVPEVDAATQARFDAGHRFEALARPLAEKIVGEDLYPCVGADGKWSASFDGLTLTGEVAWEHKSVNAELRELIQRAEGGEPIHADHLPEHYRIQMDHQALVSGARSVLFMATRWEESGELAEQFWCWYSPSAQRQMRIAAGWEQFERDIAAYVPEPETPAVVAAPVAGFGSLSLRVEGRVLASNLDAFRAGADAFLARLPKPSELREDQDFADADAAAKACADAEDRIKAAKAAALAQMADVDAVMRTADEIVATIRAARLALEKAVSAEKENRKRELVRAGVDAVAAHYAEINATLPREHLLSVGADVAVSIGASIKGLRTLASMRDKIDTAVAAAKIDASQRAEHVRQCVAVLAEHAEHGQLFPDRLLLCASKSPEDLRNLVTARIADHQRREEQRIREAEERGRQMAEIAASRQAEVQSAAGAPAAQQPLHGPANNAGVATGSRNGPASESVTRGSQPPTRIKLGDINAAIAPLSITADGLAQLGFPHVATDKAAKLYDEANFEPILSALAKVIARADLRREAA